MLNEDLEAKLIRLEQLEQEVKRQQDRWDNAMRFIIESGLMYKDQARALIDNKGRIFVHEFNEYQYFKAGAKVQVQNLRYLRGLE